MFCLDLVMIPCVEADSSPCCMPCELLRAWQAREYDRMHKFMVEALHYYTVLAQLGRSQGLDTLSSR